MRRAEATTEFSRLALAGCLLLLTCLPLAAGEKAPTGKDALRGRLLSPDAARMTLRQDACRCSRLEEEPEVVLVTLGSEREEADGTHFHPLATFAFDRSLTEAEHGQWISMWMFGPSAPGWRRHVRAFLPFPAGTPSASASTLEKLEARLHEVRDNPEEADLLVPDPVVHLGNLGRMPRGEGVWTSLRRGLRWADVFNPAQFVYRSYLVQRKDRRERDFRRAYLALEWLVNLGYDGTERADWLDSANDIRFHFLRTRSFFGRWLEHAEAIELVYNYDSSVRTLLGKSSSWLQSAANEHLLRYEPIYRYAANGASFPVGGVLYYDPKLRAHPDPSSWSIANPFDLPYNPHTHPDVQRLAGENPDELIPLAIYTFETNLGLRPIIAIDFFAPRNPKRRERNQQLMVMTKEWLSITVGALSLQRIPYRLTAWAANKKGFTYLVDKSSRRGVEELRVALQNHLYFDDDVNAALQRKADQRVLNPLIKAGAVEERLAHIQHESLRARNNEAICRTVSKVRRELRRRLKVPEGLDARAERAEMRRRLAAWRQEVRLADFASQPLGDFGSLELLAEPLGYFLEHDPVDRQEFEKLLSKLYTRLYRQQLRLPSDHQVPELDAQLQLTRQVWQRIQHVPASYQTHLARVEKKTKEKHAGRLAKEEKGRRERFRDFIVKSRKEIARAQRAGCDLPKAYPSRLESRLAVLRDLLATAPADRNLRDELERRAPRLQEELERLDASLSQCPVEPQESWLAESRQNSLNLVRVVHRILAGETQVVAAGGR